MGKCRSTLSAHGRTAPHRCIPELIGIRYVHRRPRIPVRCRAFGNAHRTRSSRQHKATDKVHDRLRHNSSTRHTQLRSTHIRGDGRDGRRPSPRHQTENPHHRCRASLRGAAPPYRADARSKGIQLIRNVRNVRSRRSIRMYRAERSPHLGGLLYC